MLHNRLQARFATGDFATGVALTERIGLAADEANHHPDLNLTYPRLLVTLFSHDVGGVTQRDLELAQTINSLAAEAGVASQTDKTPFNVLGRDRIADEMTRTTVSVVKSVGYQAYTQQLKDYVTFSLDTGRGFDLYVRGGPNPTILSSQLQEAVGLGQVNLRFIP